MRTASYFQGAHNKGRRGHLRKRYGSPRGGNEDESIRNLLNALLQTEIKIATTIHTYNSTQITGGQKYMEK